MKKIILVMLMVLMLATPCFGQEIEPDGLFSIEGTEWLYIGLAFLKEAPFIMPFIGSTSFSANDHFDFLLFSLGFGLYEVEGRGGGRGLMILQPTIGVGVFSAPVIRGTGFGGLYLEFVGVAFGYMFKIRDDDWKPTLSVIPNQGEQGSTLTGVTIITHGFTTFLGDTFLDDGGVNQILIGLCCCNPTCFLPVSNINVISNTEIEFDLQIPDNASPGLWTVTVRYDDGKKSISRNDAFEVLERTN